MGFPHYVVEAEEVFRARVLQPFLDAYAAGRTPYPCALCNQHLKFGDLAARMELIGADSSRPATTRASSAARTDAGAAAARATRRRISRYALALVPYAALARATFRSATSTRTRCARTGSGSG
jgi:tRNA-specific 2-thiouridylase